MTRNLVLVVAMLAGGCAVEPVQPWQREHLARPEMAWDVGIVGEEAMRDHTFVSKEAASGGPTLGGGGCGCN